MARKEVSTSMHEWTKEPSLTGRYAGSSTLEINGREQVVHDFRDGESTVRAWGCTVLDVLMASVRTGTLTRVEYLGKTLQTKRGMAHNFRVFVDDGAPTGESPATHGQTNDDDIPF